MKITQSEHKRVQSVNYSHKYQIMNRIFLSSLLFVFLFSNLDAQSPKRYVFLEHFTNTVCGICASKNPPLFDKIADHPNDIHHISIHPPVPYTTCEFYNENTFENEALAIPYGISGTPQLYLWGDYVSSGALLPDATLEGALGQTSPINVLVTESGTTQRVINVSVNAFENMLNGNDYRLNVAMVERIVNYNAPNGESVHHNVFRKLLTAVGGVPFETLMTGDSYNFNSTFEVSTNFDENEIYAIAWVNIFESKEVVNSGSSLDVLINSNENKWNDDHVTIFPNPTSDRLNIDFGTPNNYDIEIVDIKGSIVMRLNGLHHTAVDLSALESGVYFINITSTKGTITKKITKL